MVAEKKLDCNYEVVTIIYVCWHKKVFHVSNCSNLYLE